MASSRNDVLERRASNAADIGLIFIMLKKTSFLYPSVRQEG